MKKNAIQELQRKPRPELEKLLVESRDRLAALRNDLERGKVKNVSEIREVRKQVARIETFLHGVIVPLRGISQSETNNANAGK